MIPSGIKSVGTRNLELKKVDVGLYLVEDAYEGEYHFFARSRNATVAAVDTTLGRPETPRDAECEVAGADRKA